MKRAWLTPDEDVRGWWYVHKDAAMLCLIGAGAVGFIAGLTVAIIAVVL